MSKTKRTAVLLLVSNNKELIDATGEAVNNAEILNLAEEKLPQEFSPKPL